MKNQSFFTIVDDCMARAEDNEDFIEQKTECAHRIAESKRADYGDELGKILGLFSEKSKISQKPALSFVVS